LPNCPIASQKIKVDNKARFRYQVGYWFRLIGAPICGASAETDTKFSIFDSSASEKQLPIFQNSFNGVSSPPKIAYSSKNAQYSS
jgi:hypothetical protein